MRATISKFTFAIAFAALLAGGSLAAADPLKFGGTGSATEMMRQLGAQFTAASEIKTDVIPSLGSSGAIAALTDGNLDIAVSARALKPEEAAKGLVNIAVLKTAFVLATSNAKPNGFKAAEISKTFSAEKPMWADGTPLRIILRPRSEADSALFGNLFPGMTEAIEGARKRSEIPVAATDQDNAELAERTPGALIGTTLTQLTTEKRTLKVVPLDDVVPTLATFESGAYPYTKKFYFIASAKNAAETQKFVEFLRSPQGVQALRPMDTLPSAE